MTDKEQKRSLRIKSEDGKEICAIFTPQRKKMALAIYAADTNTYIKVASFDNVASAQYFMAYLAEMIGAEDLPPKEAA